jgi:hypothetical protein
VLGSPSRPLSVEVARAKFAACGPPTALWDAVMAAETLNDVGLLTP